MTNVAGPAGSAHSGIPAASDVEDQRYVAHTLGSSFFPTGAEAGSVAREWATLGKLVHRQDWEAASGSWAARVKSRSKTGRNSRGARNDLLAQVTGKRFRASAKSYFNPFGPQAT
jgi:hypothetical protein